MTRIMRGEWVLTNLVVSLCAAVIVAAGTGTQLAAQNITSTTSSLTPANGFSNLPLAAQAKISSVLARDAAGYQAAKRGQTVQMVNARHGLSASFTAAGVEVIAGRDRWNFVLRGYGYGDDFATGPAVAPRATANRVEYQRGTLTEWYLNGPLGLEQGFTLARTPGKRKNQPLTLAFTITGNVRAAAIRTVGVILSRTDGAAALRYHGLTAQDATGRDLRTWLEVKGQRLWLRVDDDGAEYPLVVDPIFQHAKLTASDASFDFGRSVSSSGDTVVVGAPTGNGPFFQGSAYVFVKPAGGWSASLTESAKLTASDGATNDFFGRDVAVSGDTIVIGAYGDDIGPNTEQGSAYVFVKPAGGWSGSLTESAKLTASDGAALDRFGSSVAISGDTIVVGAPVNGAAYVFVKPPAGWIGDLSESATLTASDWVAGDAFGGFGSVAVNGATIVVGAGRDDIGLNIDQGSAYVFEKPLTGWIGALTESAKLIAADGGAGTVQFAGACTGYDGYCA